MVNRYTALFISNTFIRNTRLKLAKNQKNTKKHPQAESHSSCTVSSKKTKQMLRNTLRLSHILHARCHPKIIGNILRNKKKKKCLYSWDYKISHKENEDEK